jgi:hypothetical protein
VAVFLGATVVRSLLVSTAMKLPGNRNWRLPHRPPNRRLDGELPQAQTAPVPVYAMEPVGDD